MAALFTHVEEFNRRQVLRDADAAGGTSGIGGPPTAAVIQDRSTVPDYVLLFTVVMGSAFLGEIFPSHVADFMHKNKWAKHLAALALLVVTIVWVRADMSVALLIGYTVITYAWYLSMTTMAPSEFAIIAALLFVVFVSSHMRDSAAANTPVSADASTGVPTGTSMGVPTSTSTGVPTGTSTGVPTGTSTGVPTGTSMGAAQDALTASTMSNAGASEQQQRVRVGDAPPTQSELNWRYWLEFGALTGAASLTMWFTCTHALRALMKNH
jgi:hypothetical protein